MRLSRPISTIDAAAPPYDPRPKSAVSGMTGVVGLAGLFAWAAVARAYGMAGRWRR